MNRRMWLGALALSLGGILPGLSGQEGAWLSGTPSSPPVIARAVASDPPTATLGKPIALPPAPNPAGLRPFPSQYRSAPLLASYSPASTGVEPIATAAPSGMVIAASAAVGEAPPQPIVGTIEEGTGSELFAAERDSPLPGAAAPRLLRVEPLSPSHTLVAGGFDLLPDSVMVPAEATWNEVVGRMPAGLYFGAEYLLWWTRRDRAPILATTGNPAEGPLAGRLGEPGTAVLNDGTLNHEPFSGARLTAGYFIDDCCSKAIEVSGFFLPQSSGHFSASSADFPVLARPFFSLNEGIERVQFIAFPGVATGTLTINSPSQLWGVEANARCLWCCGCDYSVDLLAGARYLNLREQLTITENSLFLPGVLPPPLNGTQVINIDSFATRNQFYGGQVGIDAQKEWGRFSIDGLFKLALGVTHQELTIQGGQIYPPGTTNVDTRPGGLLALDSNIGTYSRNRFSIVPEVGVTLGWYLTGNVQLTVGYNFLYWTNVVRPGEQIDTNVDVNRIPNFAITPRPPDVPGLHPGVPFRESDFWAQEITAGIRFTF